MSPKKKQPKATPHSLRGVARRELGLELDKEHQGSDWSGDLSPGMVEYAANDAHVLLPMADALQTRAMDAGLENAAKIERRALLAMAWMRKTGVPFDVKGWDEHLGRVKGDVDRLQKRLAELAPDRPDGEWNWQSPQQVKEAFALIGVELPDTKEETLSRCDHPLAKLLLEYRKASKMVSHFGPTLLSFVHEDGRIHPDWRQIGTETGRMSCSKLNVQQLPPEVRRYVRAPTGRVFVWADYAQAEIRVLAAASGDPTLIGAFVAGRDPYKATAANVFGVPEDEVTEEQRGVAKVLIFSFIFGASAYGIARKLGITKDAGVRLMSRFFAAHPRVEAFLKRTAQRALDKGEARTLAGRARRFGNIHPLGRKEAGYAVRQAMNHPMQGSCADGLKLALALLYERRHECPGAAPIVALHDEIIIECDEEVVDAAAAWLEQAMIDGLAEVLALGSYEGIHVPVEVEIKSGKAWGEDSLWSPSTLGTDEGEELTMSTHLDHVPTIVKVYIDYRDPSADKYPQIDACLECAEEYSRHLGVAGDVRPGEAAWCEICDTENAAAYMLTVQERGANRL
jgi:DNA polymerase-1